MPKNGHFGVLPPLTPTPLVPAGQQAMLSAMLLTVTSRRYVLLQPATSANLRTKGNLCRSRLVGGASAESCG